ncbi:O-antigen ligase family protein [Polaribacter aestuariivivens]|uniref:O-antigen ligase family protein n=1 Tax=Polaribacter aestuariivivens TaxID=2304626 RepID=UPI003F49A8DC
MSKQKIVGFGFLLFSIFPLIPNRIKGLPVILFFLSSIYLAKKYKCKALNIKKTIFLSSLFLILLISLLYTKNFNKINQILSTRLSLIIFPVSFSLIESTKIKLQKKYVLWFSKIFIFSTILFCLLNFYKIYSLGYYQDKVNINDVYNNLTNNVFGVQQHPIYSSIFISLALFFLFKEIIKKNSYLKILYFLGILFLSYILFFLSRKGILIALAISLISVFLLRFKKFSIKKIAIIGALSVISITFFTPVLKKRFKEVFYDITYKEVNSNNSSSIRYGVYGCVTKVIKNNWWLGYGIGDVQDELLKCYASKSKILVEGNYNSHNQYFSFMLSNGLLGAIFLIWILIETLKLGIKNNDVVIIFLTIFYSIAFLFENILERQSGIILFMFFLSYFNFKNYKNFLDAKK